MARRVSQAMSRSVRCRYGVAGLLGLLGSLIALWPAQGQQIHRNGFAGRHVTWLRGENNINAQELVHDLTEELAHSLPSSERIRLEVPRHTLELPVVEYYYPTQPAPVTADLAASVWLKASRSGIQFKARVILPNEKHPQRIDEPLTVTLLGDVYQLTNRWQRLELQRPVDALKQQQQLLRARYQRDIDIRNAYVDRLILNLATAAGPLDVYIDDLEIGPVQAVARPGPAAVPSSPNGSATMPSLPTIPGRTLGIPTSSGAATSTLEAIPRTDRGILVRYERDRLQVGGKPFFFRAIRYSNTPLKTLRDAGFNTVWFDGNTPQERIEEAVAHGFWIVPTLPEIGEVIPINTPSTPGEQPTSMTDLAKSRDATMLAASISRFLSGDAVLFWDLGSGRRQSDLETVARTAQAVRAADPYRPRGADIWEGFQAYSYNVELLGTHRWPLMTSLELTKYRDWLNQRRLLTTPGTFMWTWIQTHLPEGQARLLYGRDTAQGVEEPIGPHPEQIRLLTFLSIAAGCKGVGFWSDQYLADSHQGRDRLLQMALLNRELSMIEPLLLTVSSDPTWIETSHPEVKAAVLRSKLGILVLPVWLGNGMQCVPGQGSIHKLGLIVPNVPNGMQPWLVQPGQVRSLQANCVRVAGGTQVELPEFDLAAAIVFTSDLSKNGLVVWWQEQCQTASKPVAQWAIDLANIEQQKVLKVHRQLEAVAPPVVDADGLIQESNRRLDEAIRLLRQTNYASAYQEALRSLRPLRILMRTHWDQAVRTLDLPTASPYAATFYTLPRHWQFANEVRATQVSANALLHGNFEIRAAQKPTSPFLDPPEKTPATNLIQAQATARSAGNPAANATPPGKKTESPGIPVATALLGWTVRQSTVDAVDMDARIVAAPKLSESPKVTTPRDPYKPSSTTRIPDPRDTQPKPTLGEKILSLRVRPKALVGSNGKLQPAPAVLENTFLSVTTPAVRLQPGTIVRISAWVQVPETIKGTADGVLFYDSIGGEAFGVRFTEARGWTKYHLYRRVPATGVVSVTMALTGLGVANFDDVRIEPLTSTQVVPTQPLVTPLPNPTPTPSFPNGPTPSFIALPRP